MQIDAFCYLPGHPLLALAAEGQASLLRKVLEQGADPDAQDSRKYTGVADCDAPVMWSNPNERSSAGKPVAAVAPVPYCLMSCPCPHPISYPPAALHLACWHARLGCIRVLLDAGASLHVRDAGERTVWDLAHAAQQPDVQAMLQQHEEAQQALQEQDKRSRRG